MAMSSTTATTYISHKRIVQPSQTLKNGAFFPPKSLAFGNKPRRVILTNSGDVPAETATAEDSSESAIEAPTGPPSLISALNVERALRGIAITDVDHYGRLGIPRKCPYDQITVAYQKKVNELKSQGLEEEELDKQLELLKESYSILSSVEERRLYDWSLARTERPDRYAWPFESDITQTPTEDPPPQEPEDFGPTRAVGYFLLGWIALSFVLSIALNR